MTEADRLAWQQWQQGRIEDAFAEGQQAQADGRRIDALNAFERAHRLSPDDPVLAFSLGLARLHAGDVAGCLSLMQGVAHSQDTREAWLTTLSCALSLGLPAQAGRAAGHLLSMHGFDPAWTSLLDQAAAISGRVGWCALSGAGPREDRGELHISCAGGITAAADGAAVALGAARRRAGWRAWALPPDWQRVTALEVRDARGVALLGSPLRPATIATLAGFVDRDGPRKLRGWAWYPADPDRTPHLEIRLAGVDGPDGRVARLTLEASADPLPGNALARPRRIAFAVPRALRGRSLDVVDESGRSLLGAPIDPALPDDPAAFAPHPAGVASGSPVPDFATCPVTDLATCPVDIIIPVYRHGQRSLDCIHSVLDTVADGTRVIVVEDASPDAELRAALARLAGARRIKLLSLPRNRGFTHAANLGLALGRPGRGARGGRDAVLLNSDTLVGPEWLARLRRAAYAAPAIGSVTPFSNDATILSYPDRRRGGPMPDRDGAIRLARLAALACARPEDRAPIDIPTAVGFCMYIRRDCLEQVGALREDLFAQGYGEENDWCLRASALGWRHVAAPDVHVGHVGGLSFGGARPALMARNAALLERLHPGYEALVAAHIDADPLAAARRRFDRVRLLDALAAEPGRQGTVALVSHDQGGGVERVLRERIEAAHRGGRHALVLRPSAEGGRCVVSDRDDDDYPNLAFHLPDELEALVDLLREAGVAGFEWHHMLGHEPQMRHLPARLGVAYEIVVHDYAAFCPRVTLVSFARRYCGEPDLAACEACVATLGRRIDEPIGVGPLRARSLAEFAAAGRVVVPSEDVARRIARHFPAARLCVEPWEDDRPELDLASFARAAAASDPPRAAPSRGGSPRGKLPRVVLLGGIGPEKGYDVLLDCLEHERARGPELEFVIAGFTPDDARLRAAGCGPITGEYKPGELPELLAALDADIAFLPSVCPETWSFTLSEAWRAGLPAVVFDIGTPAERIRRTGRGLVLPIALPAAMICAQLAALARNTATLRQRLAKTTPRPQPRSV